MFKKIKKNLIHFSTHGNITEDFVASRREKTRKFRQVIRACFYAHCVVTLLCIAISFIFAFDKSAVIITLSTLVTAWLSFFAAGNSMPLKIVLLVADFALGGAFLGWGAVYGETSLVLCGAVIATSGVFAAASFIAALCKKYLDEIQPRDIRRCDYTKFNDLFSGITTENDVKENDEEITVLPPLTSDMRLLASKLKDILCVDEEENHNA